MSEDVRVGVGDGRIQSFPSSGCREPTYSQALSNECERKNVRNQKSWIVPYPPTFSPHPDFYCPKPSYTSGTTSAFFFSERREIVIVVFFSSSFVRVGGDVGSMEGRRMGEKKVIGAIQSIFRSAAFNLSKGFRMRPPCA